MPLATIVETDRLILREQDQNDVDSLMKIYSDPVANQFASAMLTEEQARERMERVRRAYEEVGHSFWGVVVKQTGDHIGQCGLLTQETGPDRIETEIAYMLQRAHWGKGYATEAACACRDVAFDRFDKSHVISLIDPRNEPSAHVARRIGMTIRERIFKWDTDYDIYEIRR